MILFTSGNWLYVGIDSYRAAYCFVSFNTIFFHFRNLRLELSRPNKGKRRGPAKAIRYKRNNVKALRSRRTLPRNG